MALIHTWYCQSQKNNLHAFCLLRSPYKTSVKKKIMELSDGHGFLKWEIGKLNDKQIKEFEENNFDYDTLYEGETIQ